MDYDEIIARIDCPYETVEDIQPERIMDRYKELINIGKAEGFFPVLITLSETLYEFLEFSMDPDSPEHQSREEIIEASKHINVQEFFKRSVANASPSEDDPHDVIGEFLGKGLLDFEMRVASFGTTHNPDDTYIIAKIPTDKPWEIAAWVPIGGYNDCPFPAEMVAVYKYWHEKYGAVPAAVSFDQWELTVEKPVTDQGEAMALAMEHFGFCSDSVWQGVGTVGALAGTLLDSKLWQFWWD